MMNSVKKICTAILCLLFPTWLVFWLLNLIGHRVHPGAKIGFSMIGVDGALTMKKNSKIGHFNLINTKSIQIGEGGYIGNFNSLKGPFEIVLAEKAAIGDGN